MPMRLSFLRYVYPFATVAVAVVLMRLFRDELYEYIIAIFLAAVVVSTRYGGFGPGLLSLLLSLLGATWFVLDGGHWLPEPGRLPGLGMYAVVAFVAAWLVARRQRAERDLRALNKTLEQRVAERTAELARSYELLRQSERLAAIGEMVTGLSHESRNALQRSLASLELLERRLRDQPVLLNYLKEARKAQTDLQRVYETVKDYAAPVVPKRRQVSLPDVWREAWDKVHGARRDRHAILVEELRSPGAVCDVDPFRMQQVFRNLFENAVDASSDPVEVRVALDEIGSAGRPSLRVVVSDNGPGVAAHERETIFEPFHTTKTHGTGLGLAIVRRIVEAHGGSIRTVAGSATGLTVELVLPKEVKPAARQG